MLQSQRDEKLRVSTNWLLVGWLCGKFWEACAGNCRRFAICPEIALSSVLLLLLTWVTIQPPEYYCTTPIHLAIRPPDYLGLWSTLQPETQSPLSRSMFQLSWLGNQFGIYFKILCWFQNFICIWISIVKVPVVSIKTWAHLHNTLLTKSSSKPIVA